ncbi:unnamed protein product, partial [Rotaria sp. Silwood2]
YGTPTIVQINHAGRQSPLGKRPYRQPTIAPSPIAMSMGKNIFARTLQYFVIGTPEEMTRAQIDEAVEKFADAAEIMAKANFARVEIHTSHGYLGVWDARVLHYDIRGIKIFNLLPIATIGSDVNTLWHNWRMHRVAIENQEPDPNLTVHVFSYNIQIILSY